MKTNTSNGVPLTVLHMFLAYVQIFLFCFFGEHLLNTFENLNESIFTVEWYRFPMESQKLLITMLVVAQRPISIRGFGSQACTHESFKEVVDNSSFTTCFIHLYKSVHTLVHTFIISFYKNV